MNIKEIINEQVKKLIEESFESDSGIKSTEKQSHIMLGKRCLIRTYSAGVHIGDVDYINPQNAMEVHLKNPCGSGNGKTEVCLSRLLQIMELKTVV